MPTLVLDLDVDAVASLTELSVPEPYDAVHALLRWRSVPVGAAWLGAERGVVSHARLHAALVTPAQPRIDALRVESWLRESLRCTDNPAAPPLPTMTIAICTRDRLDDLSRCLAAVCALPNDGQEVLVVDSASRTDDTRRLVALYPCATYLRNDEPGLDRARNRAMREARGDVVAFIDDDAVPDSGWLRALRAEFADVRVLGVTGLAAPFELETPAQEWFERTNGFARGFTRQLFDGAVDDVFFVARIGAGVNMALRRDLLLRVGAFDEALGAGTPTKAGDEHDMFTRILAAGYCMVYQPAALVRHRHRREWSALHDAVRGYGTGVYAYLTRQFLQGESRAPYVAMRWFAAQMRDLARGAVMPSERTRAALVLSELAGCAVGPFAYLRTRVDAVAPAFDRSVGTSDRPAHGGPAAQLANTTDVDALPRISVVIPTHNRRSRIVRLVMLLAAVDYPSSRYEVIVVANGCTDDTVAVLEALSLPMAFRVEVVPPDSLALSGASRARNHGVASATGDLLLFLDDDIEPSASLLSLHAASYRAGSNRVLIGAPIPVRNDTNLTDGSTSSFHEIAMWSWWESRLAQLASPGYRFAYDDLFTGVVSIPAALFAGVGGFDESFLCREDSELGLRLLTAGAQFCFSRESGGLHQELRDPARLAARKRAEGRADVQLARKHVALWPVLRLALPWPRWWSPMGVMRQLAFVGGLDRGGAIVLESVLVACERVRARATWRAVHGALAYYWYWRGVADVLDRDALRALAHASAAAVALSATHVIDADFSHGVLDVARRLDAERPDAIRLSFSGESVGLVPARSGSEPLRGIHLCATLVREHAASLSHHIEPAR